jgi:guanosine-3',5'-bis(diphosphate) 3'-pyrophosphohydrolase
MNDVKSTNIRFETAVRLLVDHMPISDESSRKPILFHDIRVGVYLYDHGYSQDIVLGGVLHDALEWSRITETMLRKEFGDRITNLVRANSKDDSIQDKEEKTTELITRCVAAGQDALIIKAADILDSYKFYASVNNKDELEYCQRNANAIFKHKPETFNDKIFDELWAWQTKIDQEIDLG